MALGLDFARFIVVSFYLFALALVLAECTRTGHADALRDPPRIAFVEAVRR